MAHDQPDKAARFRRLGAGLGIHASRFRVEDAVAGLAQVLSPEVGMVCQTLAAKIAQEDVIEAACRALENW